MPSYASLMVSVGLDPAAADRIELSADLAGRWKARLIGAAAAQLYVPVYGGKHPILDAELIKDEQQLMSKAFEEAEALFWKMAGSGDGEWRSAVGTPVEYLAGQARAADLVIVGRRGPEDVWDHRLGILPGDLLMELGRPMLIVPPHVDRLAASRVVVAWKDTREARRAVWDSLPLLQAAEEVFVVVVGEGGSEGEDGAADVAAFLTRHGVASAAVLRPGFEINVARTLQRTAEQQGADLIVSGAYGHSRLREWAFGGVTRDLLSGTSLCCLMSR